MSATEVAVLGIGLLVLGCALGYFLARLGKDKELARIEEMETELSKYRSDVTDHFQKTAEHFHSLNDKYRELYEHMAAGSKSLCVLDDKTPELPFMGTAAVVAAAGSQSADGAEEPDSVAESVVTPDAIEPESTDAEEAASVTTEERPESGLAAEATEERSESEPGAEATGEPSESEPEAETTDEPEKMQAAEPAVEDAPVELAEHEAKTELPDITEIAAVPERDIPEAASAVTEAANDEDQDPRQRMYH